MRALYIKPLIENILFLGLPAEYFKGRPKTNTETNHSPIIFERKGNSMNLQQAYAVLGLREGASEEEIKKRLSRTCTTV